MPETIIVSLITAGIPAIVTVISNYYQNKENRRKHIESIQLSKQNSSRASIENKILQDKIRVLFHELPENYRAIHDEYERYHAEGGNGVVTHEVADYDKWRGGLSIKRKGGNDK